MRNDQDQRERVHRPFAVHKFDNNGLRANRFSDSDQTIVPGQIFTNITIQIIAIIIVIAFVTGKTKKQLSYRTQSDDKITDNSFYNVKML